MAEKWYRLAMARPVVRGKPRGEFQPWHSLCDIVEGDDLLLPDEGVHDFDGMGKLEIKHFRFAASALEPIGGAKPEGAR